MNEDITLSAGGGYFNYRYVWEEDDADSNVLLKCGFKLEGLMLESGANKYTKNGEEIKYTAKNQNYLEEKQYKNVKIFGLIKKRLSAKS